MKKRCIETYIHVMNRKGLGIGSCDEFEVAVPFTMPGDKVEACIRKKKSGLYLSTLEKVVEPAPERIAPRCAHFASCGGCQWQHIPYPKQLEIKEQYIQQLFKEATEFYRMIPCDPSWWYRNKMEFSFSSDRQSNRYLGLIISGSKGKVISLSECHLVNSWFVEALKATRRWWENTTLEAYHSYRNTGSLRTLTLREGKRTGDRMVMLTVSGNPDYALTRDQMDMFVKAMVGAVGDASLSVFIRIQQAIAGKPTQFYEIHLSGPEWIVEELHVREKRLEFVVSPSAFFQPNTYQAERMFETVIDHVGLSRDSVVYDLYCGTGAIGICCASSVKEVYSIEISREAVIDARENVKRNQLNNVNVIQGDVGKVLRENSLPNPDVVIVDPPRSGLDREAIENLKKLKPKKIVYISCNPVSQASNIAELGYSLESVQPVDQFPHTYHIENIAVLKSF